MLSNFVGFICGWFSKMSSVAVAGLAASRLTQLRLELAKTQISEQPKPIAGDSRLQSTIADCKPPPTAKLQLQPTKLKGNYST